MTDIYEQHKAAFAHVEAFVICKGGERVATIAFKFPRDGAGRLYAYVHWLGNQMVRGAASGGGYDKRSAACVAAASLYIYREAKLAKAVGDPGSALADLDKRAFFEALNDGDLGIGWLRCLEDAGFTVLQAV